MSSPTTPPPHPSESSPLLETRFAPQEEAVSHLSLYALLCVPPLGIFRPVKLHDRQRVASYISRL